MASIPVPGQLPLFPLDKRCSKCGETKPFDAFGKSKPARDGRQSWCKACDAANKRAARAAYPEKERETKRRYLANPAHLENQYARTRQWYAAHREEVLTAKSADRKASPEKYRIRDHQKRVKHLNACKVRDRAYHAVHREERLAYGRTWREQNKDRAREASKRYYREHWAQQRAIQARWVREHPDQVNEKNRRYRTQLRINGGYHSPEEWHTLCERYGHCCLACGAAGVRLTHDHVVPVIHGGCDDINNIQPLCQPCNSRKGARHIDYRH